MFNHLEALAAGSRKEDQTYQPDKSNFSASLGLYSKTPRFDIALSNNCSFLSDLSFSQVVCIDEGTSNLDTDSEAAIQIVLRNAFKSSTVLFIAHRLKGLQNMDSIIVMDNGEIIEEGSPGELGSNTESVFYSMLQEQQNKDFQSSDN